MKKERIYQELELEVIEFMLNDVLTAAGSGSNEGYEPGGGSDELPFIQNPNN